jgi:hypothetical protein
MAMDMPFEVDPLLAADVESALAGVTVDPTQVGVSELHTQLHFRDLVADYINDRNHKLLVADLEDLFTPADHDDLTDTAQIVADNGPWSALAMSFTHPDIYDAINDLYAAVDPVSYLWEVMAAEEPESAAAAYEQLITGEWDGEL